MDKELATKLFMIAGELRGACLDWLEEKTNKGKTEKEKKIEKATTGLHNLLFGYEENK